MSNRMEVSDYADQPGSITVALIEHNGDKVIHLEVRDSDDRTVVYPTVEQSQKLVMMLLKAIHEAKHGGGGG